MTRDAYARAAEHADWLTVRAATERVLDACAPLPTEMVALDDALHRIVAQSVRSPIDQPPWDNSAMDGFAVRAADVLGATAAEPRLLRVIESVPAGGVAAREVTAGMAIRIMTGAPVPAGADSVIRVEHTRMTGESVAVLDDTDAGRNIRRCGEDVPRGGQVLAPGRPITPAMVGVLASIGERAVRVNRRPRVALVATGNELVPLDEFASVEAGRAIVDSNSWTLAAAARLAGAVAVRLGIARDEAGSLRERILAAHDCDLLVTTAGASVGDHDIVRDVLAELGYERAFWRVRMRPGSPVSFGSISRADGTRLPVFGLPGNPVSALVTWLVLVQPALRRLGGWTAVHAATRMVRAAEPMPAKAGLAHFLRVRLEPAADGVPLAHLTGPQGSGILSSVAAADALVVVPEERGALDAGDTVNAMPLSDGDAAALDFEL